MAKFGELGKLYVPSERFPCGTWVVAVHKAVITGMFRYGRRGCFAERRWTSLNFRVTVPPMSDEEPNEHLSDVMAEAFDALGLSKNAMSATARTSPLSLDKLRAGFRVRQDAEQRIAVALLGWPPNGIDRIARGAFPDEFGHPASDPDEWRADVERRLTLIEQALRLGSESGGPDDDDEPEPFDVPLAADSGRTDIEIGEEATRFHPEPEEEGP
jgi:hypothetical protein